MLQRSIAKKRSGQGGFTLIELLIVIVILGILAAIVVLAIGGLAGKSKLSACRADAKTVQVAEDAFFASPSAVPGTPDLTGGDNTQYSDLGNLYTQGLLKGTAPNPATWNMTMGTGNTTYTFTANATGKCGGVAGLGTFSNVN
jgi:prepilin-type N-terminal cleavage/methylation domain-containing protein